MAVQRLRLMATRWEPVGTRPKSDSYGRLFILLRFPKTAPRHMSGLHLVPEHFEAVTFMLTSRPGRLQQPGCPLRTLDGVGLRAFACSGRAPSPSRATGAEGTAQGASKRSTPVLCRTRSPFKQYAISQRCCIDDSGGAWPLMQEVPASLIYL